MKKYLICWFCFLSLTVLFSNCSDKNPYPIPNYTVSFLINLNANDNDLSIGSAKKFTSGSGYYGYAGVVVYRHNLDEFFAYDLACPNDHYYGCKVADTMPTKFVPEGLLVQCSKCCQATFSLLDGNPRNKGDKYSLKKYSVTKTNDSQFRVQD